MKWKQTQADYVTKIHASFCTYCTIAYRAGAMGQVWSGWISAAGRPGIRKPGPAPPLFQQPVLPWGQVPECAIITVWVGGIIGNMYGAAKSGTHQIIGIDGRGRSAGAGDCNGTGARLSCEMPFIPRRQVYRQAAPRAAAETAILIFAA